MLFFWRATRLRRELYEVLGVFEYTWLARVHGGSNVTQMKLAATPRLVLRLLVCCTKRSIPIDEPWAVGH